jgi:hypothetical protein
MGSLTTVLMLPTQSCTQHERGLSNMAPAHKLSKLEILQGCVGWKVLCAEELLT